MVALVLYAFAARQRSSRAIERHCRQDVAYRVITGNLIPDHATIARFICRHDQALAELFGEVLKLCDRAGLVKPGVVSIDGTRIAGKTARRSTTSSTGSLGRCWPRPGRPTRPRTSSTARRAAMSCPSSCARRRAGASSSARPDDGRGGEDEHSESTEEPAAEAAEEVPLELDAARIVARTQGQEGWLREGKRQLEQHRWRQPDPIPRSRPERLLLAAGRWRPILRSSGAPTRPTSAIGRPPATGSVGGRGADRSRIGRPRCRPGR